MDKNTVAPLSELSDITQLLLDKYCNIIGAQHKEGLLVEKIIDLIISYYESIITSMPGNVYWLDKNCIGMGCNKNVLDMFGFKTLAEFRGLTFEEMGKAGGWTYEATQSFKNDTLEVVRTGKARMNVEEPPIPHSDGRLLYFLTSRVPLLDNQGKVVGVVGNSIDITDRKRAEQLAKEKEIVREKLVLTEAFAGTMAHDLRTPIGSLSLCLDNIRDVLEKENQDPDKQKKLLAELFATGKETVKKAMNFISMRLRKIRNLDKKLTKEDLDLCMILEDVKDALAEYPFSEAERTHVTLNKENAFVYFGNNLDTQHIIFNLLGNALKIIREDDKGHINISFEQDEDCNKLIFYDDARGIAPEFMPTIFDAFVSKDTTGEGTGLGLSFCKTTMLSYDGNITCESKLGEYTKFILSFPKVDMEASMSEV